MYKKQLKEKLRSNNVSPTNYTETNSYTKKYSKKLLSRQSINQQQENYTEYLTITNNSSPKTQCSTILSPQQQIVQKQKKEISILKLGCSKCLSKQNRDLDLRNKIILQNKRILELISQEEAQYDYAELQRINNNLQQQNEELKKSQEILIMNQMQILQENQLLKSLFTQNKTSLLNKENSSQFFSQSQSLGMFSSILQFNNQMYSPIQVQQSIMERETYRTQ